MPKGADTVTNFGVIVESQSARRLQAPHYTDKWAAPNMEDSARNSSKSIPILFVSRFLATAPQQKQQNDYVDLMLP
jgi:hypothetical protein